MVAGNPYGEFDAIAIWNRKAKFLAGESGDWRDMNAPAGAAHPGYPLLLSASIAREWTLAGESTSEVTAVLSGLYTLATAGLLCGALALTIGEATGLLALLVFLAGDGFLWQAGSQYADIPMSFYVLATLVLLGYAASRDWPPACSFWPDYWPVAPRGPKTKAWCSYPSRSPPHCGADAHAPRLGWRLVRRPCWW